MSTHTLVLGIIIGLVFLWAIFRQITPRRVNRFPFIILPLIGLYESVHSLPRSTISANQLTEAAIALSISIVIGFLQAQVTAVYTETDGVLYMRGGWVYLILWIVLFVSRIATDIVFHQSGNSLSSMAWIIWAELACVWGVRGIVLYLKHPEIRSQLARRKGRRCDV
ncbi:hypothetical protein [Alicyclobacillus sp. SO9]|uniref:hypothetical protein n=1 Tax=Alicyclobacillus sp. SO9 TaxID=2665646 RepID=UPI0018E7056E|nr:hypothetical protein [Alicyclobacillus sp. SO9]QQE80026.1 hypothetical protein GI364_06025 [Alicyclobacillus sp. SO9]